MLHVLVKRVERTRSEGAQAELFVLLHLATRVQREKIPPLVRVSTNLFLILFVYVFHEEVLNFSRKLERCTEHCWMSVMSVTTLPKIIVVYYVLLKFC